MNDTEVRLAEQIARQSHQGQVRWDGAGYVDGHVAPIAARARELYGAREEAIAWLHDVVEDTRVTADDLLQCGVSADTVRSVLLLTRQKHVPYARHIAALASSGDVAAIRVKMLDLEHNATVPLPSVMRPAFAELHRQRVAKYQLALMVLTAALDRG